MRKNIKNAASKANSNLKKYHNKRRWRLLLISNLFLAAIFGFWYGPKVVDQYRMEAQTREIMHQLEQKRLAYVAEKKRQVAEKAVMDEFYCLATTLYWEAERNNAIANQAIADVVLSRVESPLFPDTICEVTKEVTKNHRGAKVAQFSYIFDIIGKRAPYGESWKFSRLQAAIALKNYWDGQKPSGNLNYHANYVKPAWSTKDVEECKKRVVPVTGTIHIFYAPVAPQDRAECLEERKLAEAKAATDAVLAKAKNDDKVTLPRKGPVPRFRPANDKIAQLILVKG